VKLSLLTYNIARTWPLARIIEVARAGGFAGVEFRAELGHAHGVAPETTAVERRAIRERSEDANLEVACLGTSARFASPEATARQAVVEHTTRYLELAGSVRSPTARGTPDVDGQGDLRGVRG
jgi:sugar phosphate isomerase/epimerase